MPSLRWWATAAFLLGCKGEATQRFPNRLLLESSPYLQAAAREPIDWRPFGPEALAEARASGRPIFLSIGYAACHWCHVMSRGAFADERVAAALNRGYIAVRVDRQERPDLDAAYLAAAAKLTRNLGWPLSLWLDPEGRPYFAGTFYPPDELLGLLEKLRTPGSGVVPEAAPRQPPADEALRRLEETFDPAWGGFGRGAKFPRPEDVSRLLHGDARQREMAVVTLERMAAGGIQDQLAGGFHRYATDARWRLPHFEKMLPDQAELALLYLDAWLVTRRADLRDVAAATLHALERDFAAPGGGFVAALDAEAGGVEGAPYLWTAAELQAVLGPARGAQVARAFDVGVHPSPLWLPRPADVDARERALLLLARAARPQPKVDTQVLVGWNGLVLQALARRALVLGTSAEPARRLASFLLEAGDVHAVGGRGPGLLEDHAQLIAGLLDLVAVDPDPRWLAAALDRQARIDARFAAPGGGYYQTPPEVEAPLGRVVPPEANAVAARARARLLALRGEPGSTGEPQVIVVDAGQARRLVDAALAGGARALVVAPEPALRALAELAPALADKPAAGGRSTAYVCIETRCGAPATEPEALAEQLRLLSNIGDTRAR